MSSSVNTETEIRSIHTDFNNLIHNYEMLDNQLSVYYARKMQISIELSREMTDNELLILHGTEYGYNIENNKILNNSKIYRILLNGELKLSFKICEHLTYIPLNGSNIANNDCLRCN